jgi:predicted dehydrogenase
MTDIGVVGLDTSHPESFARSIEEHDAAEISAVWDGGDVRDEEYAQEFCETHGGALCEEVEDVIPLVDAAMVLTVNWDTHAELAAEFLDAGVPTLVDKPVAGRLPDVETLADAAETTPLFGGSSIPYHPALADLPTGDPGRSLYCVGYNDPFYYGAHVLHVASSLAGADWYSVAPASDPGLTVDVLFENDAFATVRLDGVPPHEGGGFGFMSAGDRTESVLVDGDGDDRRRMYDSFVDAFVRCARGDARDNPPVLDAARLLLATHAALDADRPITPESPELREYHADGAAFLSEYKSR